jgi:hypothetical protein
VLPRDADLAEAQEARAEGVRDRDLVVGGGRDRHRPVQRRFVGALESFLEGQGTRRARLRSSGRAPAAEEAGRDPGDEEERRRSGHVYRPFKFLWQPRQSVLSSSKR